MTCFPYLGGEIAKLRKARGITLQQFAQLVGVREATILNLEAGKYFKADLLEWILSSLGCHLMIAQDNLHVTFIWGVHTGANIAMLQLVCTRHQKRGMKLPGHVVKMF